MFVRGRGVSALLPQLQKTDWSAQSINLILHSVGQL